MGVCAAGEAEIVGIILLQQLALAQIQRPRLAPPTACPRANSHAAATVVVRRPALTDHLQIARVDRLLSVSNQAQHQQPPSANAHSGARRRFAEEGAEGERRQAPLAFETSHYEGAAAFQAKAAYCEKQRETS